MNYKLTKITIISLLFLVSFGGLVFAEESCPVLYNKQSVLINGYDKNQDKKVSLEEAYQAVSDWYNNSISDVVLLDILKFSRQNCVIPSIENDPVSGTLSSPVTQVNVGETIVLTVTGKDNDGLQNLWAYYQGKWHNKPVQGVTATTTFSFSESKPGTYTYKGYIYGSQPTGIKETSWTTPQTVTVTVVEHTTDTVINCQQKYGEGYWCTNYNDWQKECLNKGKINYLPKGEMCFLSNGGNAYYCGTCKDEGNDLASGTLSVSSTIVKPGDNITLTVTGQDDNGLYSLLVYYQGAWHSELVQGTTASKTFSFSESQAGIYNYFGYVYGKTPNGNLEFNWTEPKMVTVTVANQQAQGPDLIVSSVTTSPSSLTASDDVDFKVTIKNVGTQQMPIVSGGIITKVSSSSMEGSGYRICDAMTTRLQAGESATIDCSIAQKLSQGNYSFTFFVDSSNRLTEGNENNNTLSKSIQVATGSSTQNDPVSGTLSASAKETDTEHEFVLSVTAQDDQGVDQIRMFYKGDWHTFDCAGQKSCTKTYQLSESIIGTYTYYAKVYGYDLNGNSENTDTNPSYVRVMITTANIISCTDSDGGANYYTYGAATPGSSAIEGRSDCCKTQYSTNMGDAVNHIGTGGGSCVSSGIYLYEAICQNGIPYMTVYACPNGCQNGFCR